MVITLTLIYKAKIDGSITYSYDVKNNLAVSTNIPNGQFGNYRYDSFKQRVAKTVNGFTTYFVYNNGQLIGEYDANGNVISEHIYFGLRPIALYKNNQIMTVHSDYLGTPREVQSGNSTIWYWENTDVFGANLPTVSSIEYNLRFSGQYFDKENKLHYNINRTYNPKLGRYMQSDPLGLAPGFNTYQYVNMNPLNYVDPDGLDCVATGQRVKCNVPNGPVISFPRPEGWPDSFKKGDVNYHEYNKWTNAKNTDKTCLTNYIINNPTPGNPNTASFAGTPNNATPYLNRVMSNPVISYLAPYGNSHIVINVTQKGHSLFPGYVVRQITHSKEGEIINNFGEGIGELQNPVDWRSDFINNVWYDLNQKAIDSCSCQK